MTDKKLSEFDAVDTANISYFPVLDINTRNGKISGAKITARTNCLTEIPQTALLTLNNGTLTLAAGSKAYVPNGVNIFREDIIASNLTYSLTTSVNDGEYLVWTTSNSTTLVIDSISVNSGTTFPTSASTGMKYYKTDDNKIYRYDGTNWIAAGYSLPLGIVNVEAGVITAIKQLFNGLGYVGSTIFALPGIKGLIPNGYNSDGSLKNTEITVTAVRIVTNTNATSTDNAVVIGPSAIGITSTPSYNAAENKNYSGQNVTGNLFGAYFDRINGRVSNFRPKTIFHAVDYSEFLEKLDMIHTHNLFDFKWSDHQINDLSWLRADTFSWQSGTTYSEAYKHLVNDIIGITPVNETVGSYTISVYVAADGHKITLDEDTADDIYEEIGISWYYILDTENSSFKLPRTKFGFTGYRDVAGNYVAPGLPNITGIYGASELTEKSANVYTTGAFYDAGKHPTTKYNADGDNDGAPAMIGFDASRSSAIYGASDTVQPPATQMYLYFYVGNFSRSAIAQTAGITSEELNNKADKDLSNVSSNIKYVVDHYQTGMHWYRLWSDGWLEQGGATTPSSSATKVVSFLKPFTTTNYTVTFGKEYSTTSTASGSVKIGTKKTTGFDLLDSSTSTVMSYWEARGY